VRGRAGGESFAPVVAKRKRKTSKFAGPISATIFGQPVICRIINRRMQVRAGNQIVGVQIVASRFFFNRSQ
jgi:hypothetical protein